MENNDDAKIRELKEELEKVKSELLDLLDRWYTMKSSVQQRIMFVYDNIFGDLEFEIENKTKRSGELERKVDLLSIKVRKGEKLTDKTIEFVNKVVEKEFNRSAKNGKFKPNNFNNKSYTNGFRKNGNGHSRRNIKISSIVNDNYEIMYLYRQIVKKLHPDIAGESELFIRFWDNVQDAYRNRNLIRLRLFHQTLCFGDNLKYPNRKAEESSLKMQIDEINKAIDGEKRRFEELKDTEPFSFEDKLNDRVWIAKRKRQLRDKLFQIDRKIHHHKKLLRTLTSGSSMKFNGNNGREKAYSRNYA